MIFKVMHGFPIYKVACTACPCFLASNLFRNIIKQLPNTLCHMARSIPSTCLLARARGNETVLYAIWQEVFQAHAFWQGLWSMREYFMPYGKKYSEHMPFGKGSGNNGSPCFCFKNLKMPIRSATDTMYYSSQEEESCQHSHARNT